MNHDADFNCEDLMNALFKLKFILEDGDDYKDIILDSRKIVNELIEVFVK